MKPPVSEPLIRTVPGVVIVTELFALTPFAIVTLPFHVWGGLDSLSCPPIWMLPLRLQADEISTLPTTTRSPSTVAPEVGQ